MMALDLHLAAAASIAGVSSAPLAKGTTHVCLPPLPFPLLPLPLPLPWLPLLAWLLPLPFPLLPCPFPRASRGIGDAAARAASTERRARTFMMSMGLQVGSSFSFYAGCQVVATAGPARCRAKLSEAADYPQRMLLCRPAPRVALLRSVSMSEASCDGETNELPTKAEIRR